MTQMISNVLSYLISSPLCPMQFLGGKKAVGKKEEDFWQTPSARNQSKEKKKIKKKQNKYYSLFYVGFVYYGNRDQVAGQLIVPSVIWRKKKRRKKYRKKNLKIVKVSIQLFLIIFTKWTLLQFLILMRQIKYKGIWNEKKMVKIFSLTEKKLRYWNNVWKFPRSKLTEVQKKTEQRSFEFLFSC